MYCGLTTRVINSRQQKRINQVWRRRQCIKCKAVFTTNETVDIAGVIMVRHEGLYKPFSRDNLFLSIYDSLKHRKTALEDSTALTLTVLGKLYPLIQEAAISREAIVQTTAQTLDKFDKIAATHYRAFHSYDSR